MSPLKPEQRKEKEKDESHEENWLLASFFENVNHGEQKEQFVERGREVGGK